MRNGPSKPWRVRPAGLRAPACVAMRSVRRGWRRLSHRFGDDGASVAIMAAATLAIMVTFTGGAIDYARSLDGRTRLQTAVDTALLATASHYMANPQLDENTLARFFRERLKGEIDRRLEKKMKISVDSATLTRNNDTFLATAQGSIDTRFLSIIGINSIKVKVEAASRTGFSRLEIAMVLDVSSSMSETGATGKKKIEELKEAATNFVNVMHERFAETDTPEDKVRIAIVPFSQYVNVGTRFRDAFWLKLPYDSEDARAALNEKSIYWQGCVGSRPYSYNLNDNEYDDHPIPAVMNYPRRPNTTGDKPEDYDTEGPANHCPAEILPLTSAISDADVITKAIDAMESSYGTYIPGGLMWGWRVLSKKHPFDQGTLDEDVKGGNVRRVLILMTDGANTRAPGDNVQWPDSEHQLRGKGAVKKANLYFGKACRKLKRINPRSGRRFAEVVTVAFNIGEDQTTIRNLLTECATLGMFDAKDGELTETFENIADRIGDLYLSR